MKKKGFTLIELLAVIVILAAIAIITVPTILGVIERARKGAAESSALGYIDAIEKQIALDSVEGIIHQDKDDYVYDEIEVSVKGTAPTGGLYTLNSNKVTAGTFCINNYTVEYSENKAKASPKCTGEDLKSTGSVKLSKSSTNISYPNTDTFEVIENKSGGNLTWETSDSSIATCSITNNTVTVKSGKKEGNATLTIKSKGNSEYRFFVK